MPKKGYNRQRVQDRHYNVDGYPCDQNQFNNSRLCRQPIGQLRPALSQNALAEWAESTTLNGMLLLQMVTIYVEKATVIKTHLNHDEHVEAIEKGRHYLAEA